MASRFRGSKLVIRDCPPEQSHFDPPTPKHKALARRLKSRLSTWRLVPKLPKRRTLTNLGSLRNSDSHDKPAKKQNLGRSITVAHLSSLAKLRQHKTTPSTSSNDTRLDESPPKVAPIHHQSNETDPFIEENVLETSLDALLMLLPDGSSTPRRHDSIQRQSALPPGLDLSKKMASRSPLIKSDIGPSRPVQMHPNTIQNLLPADRLTPVISQHTSSTVTEDDKRQTSNEQIQYKKHPSPSKRTLQSLKAYCQEVKQRPRTAFSFRKSATVQDLSAGMYGLYEATTVSQKRRSTPSRKVKLVHLRGKPSKSVIPPATATEVTGATCNNISQSTSESTLAATPPPENAAVQHPKCCTDTDFGETIRSERTLRLQPVNLQKSSMSPPRRYTAKRSDKSTGIQQAPGSFTRELQPVRILLHKENLNLNSTDKKKHPSPTKAEWEILGGHWMNEMDKLGLRVCGLAPAPAQLDSMGPSVLGNHRRQMR